MDGDTEGCLFCEKNQPGACTRLNYCLKLYDLEHDIMWQTHCCLFFWCKSELFLVYFIDCFCK